MHASRRRRRRRRLTYVNRIPNQTPNFKNVTVGKHIANDNPMRLLMAIVFHIFFILVLLRFVQVHVMRYRPGRFRSRFCFDVRQ